MTQKAHDPRFEEILAALRHPDVELRVDDEVMRGSLVRLGVLMDRRELVVAASTPVLLLDRYAWHPMSTTGTATSNTTTPSAT